MKELLGGAKENSIYPSEGLQGNFFEDFLPIPLHLKLRSVMCNVAEENQAHCCNPYDLRVQEQPLFLVCSSISNFTSMGLDP